MMRAIVLAAALGLLTQPAAADELGPSTVVEAFSRSWNSSDVKEISALFAPDADFIAPDGLFAKGRASIEAYYAAAFAQGFAGSTGVGEIIQQRKLSPELALLDARFTIRGAHNQDGSRRSDQKGSMAAVLRYQGAKWQIIALRERGGSAFTPFP